MNKNRKNYDKRKKPTQNKKYTENEYKPVTIIKTEDWFCVLGTSNLHDHPSWLG